MTGTPQPPPGGTPVGGWPAPAAGPWGQNMAAPAASIMTGASIECPIFFNPEIAQAKWTQARRNRTSRIISLAVSLAITAAIYWFWRDQLGGLTWPILGISVALPLGYLLWAVVKELVAKGDARRVHDGLALGVTREGVLIGGLWVPWVEVSSLKARSSRLGRSPSLVVSSCLGPSAELPLDYLAARPAGVDSAIRALSGGRCSVDFSGLDA